VTDQPVLSPDKKTPWLRPELVAPWWKIINVLFVMLGVGIISGALYGTKHSSGDFYRMMNDYHFLRDAFLESLFLSAFLFFLRWRGWKPSDFRMHFGGWTTFCGICLFVLTYFSAFFVVHNAFLLARMTQGTAFSSLLLLFLPIHYGVPDGTVELHWLTVFTFPFLNAFYEEIVYLGYAFNQWAQKFGAKNAFFLTLAFRMGVHIYQGSEHILQIAVLSTIFGLWYWKQGKLWPLILGHALIDLMSLGLFKIHFAS